MLETVDVSAQVMVVDKNNRVVTLEIPGGKIVTKKVDPAVKVLDTLKKDDSVHVR